MTAPGNRGLRTRVEGEGRDNSMWDNKWCSYNQVKNKVGALHHSFHQNKFQVDQNFNIKTTRKKIEYDFNNEIEKLFKIGHSPEAIKQKIDSLDYMWFFAEQFF